MTDTIESTVTLEQLNKLTRTGQEHDTWTGARLQEEINKTRLILLFHFDRKEHWEGDRLARVSLERREIWFVSKQATTTETLVGLPALFDDPAQVESTTWSNLAAGQEWYTATRYYIGHRNRFLSGGFGQLPTATLSAWLASGLADLTASFDEALDFLTT